MAAPGAMLIFAKYKNQFKMSDLASANLRMQLHTSTYAPNITVTGNGVLADLTNEVATGQGYTTGGVALTGVVAATAGNDGYKLSSGNASWTASGTGIPACRYAVLYYLGALWGVTNPLIGYILLDSAPADIPLTAAGNTLAINCPATGWLDTV
jgi:hypothetical protein